MANGRKVRTAAARIWKMLRDAPMEGSVPLQCSARSDGEGLQWAGQDAQDPLAWFLPAPKRIRGGLARHFASAWLFHRGIHLESTLAELELKVTQFQTVGVHDRWRIGGFYYFSQESTLAKIQPV